MMIDLIEKINKYNERSGSLQRNSKRKREILDRARLGQHQLEHTQNIKMIMVSGEEWLSSHSCAAQVR